MYARVNCVDKCEDGSYMIGIVAKHFTNQKRSENGLRKLLVVVGVFLTGSSLAYSGYQRMGARNHAEQINELKAYVRAPEAVTEKVRGEKYSSPYADIFKMNPDMVAWLKIPDAKVDYPVMQTKEDEEYYMYRDFYGEPDKNGCLVLAAAANIDPPSGNLLIHGHNMKSGEMFGELDLYKDQEYEKRHNTMILYTENEERTYQIMAVFYGKVINPEDDGFRYYRFFGTEDDEKFRAFYDGIMERRLYDTGVTADKDDELITLSTCTNREKRERLAIVGKRIS